MKPIEDDPDPETTLSLSLEPAGADPSAVDNKGNLAYVK